MVCDDPLSWSTEQMGCFGERGQIRPRYQHCSTRPQDKFLPLKKSLVATLQR
jgi:hypothetical protein